MPTWSIWPAWVVFNADMVTPDMPLDAVAHAGDSSRHEYTAMLLE